MVFSAASSVRSKVVVCSPLVRVRRGRRQSQFFLVPLPLPIFLKQPKKASFLPDHTNPSLHPAVSVVFSFTASSPPFPLSPPLPLSFVPLLVFFPAACPWSCSTANPSDFWALFRIQESEELSGVRPQALVSCWYSSLLPLSFLMLTCL